MCLRPATPGFLITLAATVCLVVVCFSVPWFKTVYFLKASLAVENMTGDITFGTLGYCLDLPGNSTCTTAKVGYQLDTNSINELLGLNGAIQIPNLFVSWLTYPLVLHIVGLVLAAIAALFGLLAHVREMSMTCFSTCFSGFAATIVLIAFIFDLVIFFLARARMNSVSGGSASIGNAVWLTLASWLLLFFAGCAFGFGRCCISRRPPPTSRYDQEPNQPYNQAMRMDAIKADSDRRNRQQTEVGLPAFPAVDIEAAPLTAAKQEPEYLYLSKDEDEEGSQEPYRDRTPSPGRSKNAADGSTRPVQTLDAPYQPVFRPPYPESSGPYAALEVKSQDDVRQWDDSGRTGFGSGNPPYAVDTTVGGRHGTNQYDHPERHVSEYSPALQGMPEPMPMSHYDVVGSARGNDYSAYRGPSDPLSFDQQPPASAAHLDPYSHRTDNTYGYDFPVNQASRTTTSAQMNTATYQGDPAYHSPTYQEPTQTLPTYQTMGHYESPYLPQPDVHADPPTQFAPSRTMGDPHSPTSPRGPRPPSAPYSRQ